MFEITNHVLQYLGRINSRPGISQLSSYRLIDPPNSPALAFKHFQLEVENAMPIRGRRKVLRSAKDSNWASATPSVYSLSSLGLDTPHLATPAGGKIASFYKYVEGQRLQKGLQGPRSLKYMAMESLIRNLSELDDLNDLPKHLIKCLWNMLKRRCMLSFHSWRILSKALCTEEDLTFGMFHYSKTVRSLDSPLQVYIKPLISKTFDFVTSLSINFACSIVELVRLAEISNLGILEIINSDPSGKTSSCVGDMVLRAWSREADKNGAFSVLRILRLWNHDDLTGKSLQYIKSFPALALFDVRDCGISNDGTIVREADKLGWLKLRDSNILAMLEEKCEQKKKISEGSPPDLAQADRKFTHALWPDSKVYRVARSNARSFFTQGGTISKNDPLNDYRLFNMNHARQAAHSSTHNDGAKWPEYVTEVAEGDEEWASLSWDIFCDTEDKKPWESSYMVCWARIGEIREDQDLMLAGVRGIEQQVFLGSHLVSPVPMAYIRLGDAHQSYGLWEGTSTKFYSESLEEPSPYQGDLISIPTLVKPPSQPVNGSQLNEASIEKRKMGGLGRMRSLKKQKLDDVLNGFNSG